MLKSIFLVVLTSVVLNKLTEAQSLNKIELIEYLTQIDEKVVEHAKIQIARYEKELFALKEYVADYEESTQRHFKGLRSLEHDTNGGEESSEEKEEKLLQIRTKMVASNPLLIYRLGHRYVTKFTRLLKLLLKKNPQRRQFREMLATFVDPQNVEAQDLEIIGRHFGVNHVYVPQDIDFQEAVESLVFLYDSYEPSVTPENFAARFSPDTKNPVDFNAAHSVKLSLKAFYHGLYASAIDWITHADNLIEKNRDYSVSKELVRYTKQFMIKTHNKEHEHPPSNFSTRTFLSFFETVVPLDLAKIVHNRSELKTRKESLLNLLKTKPDEIPCGKYNASVLSVLYNSLCKGNPPTLKTRTDMDLKCYLNFKSHPFSILSPFKVEELSKSPKILQVYEVINTKEKEVVMRNIFGDLRLEPDLRRAYFPDENGTRDAPSVTSIGADVDLMEWRSFEPFGQKAEMLTGLSIFGDEVGFYQNPMERTFRLTEYVAGKYGALRREIPFQPPQRFYEDEDGERIPILEEPLTQKEEAISTIMFFLTPVEEGGEIVFPVPEIVAKPVQGSALFWDHLDNSGLVRDDIWFGDCTVARGHKIVISKSFHLSRQWDRLSCAVK